MLITPSLYVSMFFGLTPQELIIEITGNKIFKFQPLSEVDISIQ